MNSRPPNNENLRLEKAVMLLLQGEVVGIPTETVYGLAACISNPKAIEKIFTTKERPFFDPLIVHVKDKGQAKTFVKTWSPAAEALANKYWPGPVTLVLEKLNISDLITSGLSTVGLRCPKHPLALKLIEKVGEPLAAPSANKFGKTSPSTAKHVTEAFGETLFVLDGGDCQVGIESTIVKVDEFESKIELTILRTGIISPSELKTAVSQLGKPVEIKNPGKNIEAPGQVEHHYMPKVPIVFFNNTPTNLFEKISTLGNFKNPKELLLSNESAVAARQLYSKMRDLAEDKCDIIYFCKQDAHTSEKWLGIMDRLTRASSFKF